MADGKSDDTQSRLVMIPGSFSAGAVAQKIRHPTFLGRVELAIVVTVTYSGERRVAKLEGRLTPSLYNGSAIGAFGARYSTVTG